MNKIKIKAGLFHFLCIGDSNNSYKMNGIAQQSSITFQDSLNWDFQIKPRVHWYF